MATKVNRRLLQECGSRIRDELQDAFPNLNIDISYETMERVEDAYLWIRGDLQLVEKAAMDATNLTSQLLENKNVSIVPRVSIEIWCKKRSRRSYPISERIPKPPPGLLWSKKDKQGVLFNCFLRKRDQHEHDWGNVKPQW
ncbi:MAG: hypothetical protein EXR50_04415 [Dehalococcoidia bacterium]|nr:hypothetical protein [Dehalococcoidia bacterium]